MSGLTAEEVATALLKFKADTWGKFEDMNDSLQGGTTRMDDIEASIYAVRDDLKHHELQRTSYQDELKKEIGELKSWFSQHDGKEMEKYDEIINALKDLTVVLTQTKLETDENTFKLKSKEQEEIVNAKVEAKLDEHFKDFREYKKKAISSLIIAGTLGVGGILWQIFKSGIH